jgi:hypothetical protein
MTRRLIAALLVSFFGCGDGGGGQATPLSGPNVVAVVVDQGPSSLDKPDTNGLYVTVTLCEPGTSNCQTIDHMLVDTGSVGVRVLESELTLTLPAAQDASGLALAECVQFVDGSSAWGPVKLSDIQVGGEAASMLPIQVIGSQSYPMASDCTGTSITNPDSLGANGILGVGVSLNDCGAACAQTFLNPGLYYSCASTQAGACKVVAVPVDRQVPNPVAAFPDNNGVMIRLSSVPASGAPSVSGQMVFGVGTQANNGLGSANVFLFDPYGNVETAFPAGGTQYPSYLDTGTNGLFFLDSTTTNLPLCTGGLSGFYCPTSTENLSATVVGSDGTSSVVDFSVANASRLAARNFAFGNLAGPMPGFSPNASLQLPGFDWGLPFFFGRTVFVAIEGQTTPAGPGPYFAF